MYIPKPINIFGDFFAVKETGWIPVNRNGDVLGINSTIVKFNPNHQYFRFNNFLVHRAVALTFLDCPGDPDKFMVNHKDGNKHNNCADNLEWCTAQENAVHAYRYGLRNDNKGVDVKHLETGVITSFYSLQECARFFEVNGATLHSYLNRPVIRPFKIFYDVKYANEDWHNLTADDIIEIEERGSNKLILAYSIDATKKHLIFQNATTAAKTFNVSPALITWYIGCNGSGGSNEFNGYLWYFLRDYSKSRKQYNDLIKNSDIKLSEFEFNHKPKTRRPSKLKVTNLATGDYVIWNSLQDYADSKGIIKNSLEKRINANNGIIHGFKYEYLKI